MAVFTKIHPELKEVYEKSRKMLEDIGIHPSDRITNVTIDEKTTSRWGCCRKMVNSYHILVSRAIMAYGYEETQNTMLHELLHTTKDVEGHHGLWRKRANAVKKAYGINIKRATTKKELREKYGTLGCSN